MGRLTAYLDTLAEWGRRVNLTGARTPGERVTRLIARVLPAARVPLSGSLLDVGSGNGSPGLVIALLREDLQVTLLEPRTRRWAFLREAARRAGRADIRVLRARHDTYPGPPARTVMLRALVVPLPELAPLVEPEGLLVVLGRRPGLAGPFEPEPPMHPPREDLHIFRRSPREGVSRET
ncbi:MAG: class I SAM-dependent methyltransferase [Acidobacteriota bacterium]